MNEAAQICARLIVAGAIPRNELQELDHPAMRADVENRLRSCGLCLASGAYSDHYGVQLAAETADESVLDAATNLGLGTDACALLTVLWARLALQRRTAEDTHATPADQQSLLPGERARQANAYVPSVRFETIEREFGAQLGGRTRLRALLGLLRRLGFVRYHTLDKIEAGPLLELGIEGERMIAFVRSRVLAGLLGIPQTEETSKGMLIAAQSKPSANSKRVGALTTADNGKNAAGSD